MEGDGSGRERGNHMLRASQSWLLAGCVGNHSEGVTSRRFLLLRDQPSNFQNHPVGFIKSGETQVKF